MTVVVDADPLIFLGKLDRLDLIGKLFAGVVWVPKSVAEEVLPQQRLSQEAPAIQAYLSTCKLAEAGGRERTRRYPSALSKTDRDVIDLALDKKADWLLCDDRQVRLAAELKGLRCIGTLGLLLKACRVRLLKVIEARAMVDDLIRRHGFRIGIEVYQAVLVQLDAPPRPQPRRRSR